jgi:hypothetical protein
MDLHIHTPVRLHGVVLNYLSTGTTIYAVGTSHKAVLHCHFSGDQPPSQSSRSTAAQQQGKLAD